MGFLFGKRRSAPKPEYEYDREKEYPVLRCSICNGEQVAGFKNRENGHFREAGVIRSKEELEAFCAGCGVASVPKEY